MMGRPALGNNKKNPCRRQKKLMRRDKERGFCYLKRGKVSSTTCFEKMHVGTGQIANFPPLMKNAGFMMGMLPEGGANQNRRDGGPAAGCSHGWMTMFPEISWSRQKL